MYRFLHNHQITDETTGKVIGYKDLNQIGELLKDSIIRRTKKQVHIQLPDRQDKNLFVPMTQMQTDIHDELYGTVCKLVNRWIRTGFLSESDRQRLMICMNQMRMVCDSTFILDQETRFDTKIDELMSILEDIFSMENEKVVIFSQWERMTRLVALELESMNVKFEYLHGGIPAVKRKDLLTNFKDNPESKVFLSTDAGGVGLNLQSAAWIINLDIPWNPAVLEQRIGRVYRLGQKKKVNIINLVSSGTIEHRMLDVLKFKSSLAGGVLDSGDNSILMSESRFTQFMKEMQSMVDEPVDKIYIDTEDDIDKAEAEKSTDNMKENATGVQSELFDKDLPSSSDESKNKVEEEKNAQESSLLIKQLGNILSNPETISKLASSLTETDKQTGQTYFKLPVESEDAVVNLLNGLGSLIKGLKM
jgi:superfamily II DNA/RNA helicase